MPKRLGFFTRLLDQGSAQTRYRLAAEQIRHAERLGFDSAWIAQHHFHEQEGGLPSPLVFLAHVAAQTDRIRLGTAIITLPMENPLRVAEDAAVLDLLTDGRLEVGFGSGGTPTSFLPFGLTSEQRGAAFADHLHLIHSAWRGDTLSHGHPASHVCRWTPFRTRSLTPTWRRCRTALRRGSSPRAPPSSPTVTPTPCRSPSPVCASRRLSTGRRVIR